MSLKTDHKKIKILQFKDIISIFIILVMLLATVCSVLGSVVNISSAKKVVTTRDLAMFASISYADLEKIPDYNKNLILDTNQNDRIIDAKTLKLNRIDKIDNDELTFKETDMVTDSQLSSIQSGTTLLGIPLSDENENTYDYLFYNLASTNEVSDWKIVNYTKFRTTVLKGTAEFTAMTFKRNNDIVIAYRGTDFDDIGDWTQDLLYGLVGYAGQEAVAQDYARIVAEHYKKENPNINIYITGHSLGGYLAQIGGSTLVKTDKYANNVKEIGYFNGMGLEFFSNIALKLKSKTNLFGKYDISNYEYNELTDKNSILNTTQKEAKTALTNWKNNGGKLISYNINGDLISSIGTHIGEQRGFNAYSACITHHNGNQKIYDGFAQILLKTINPFLNKDVSKYVQAYRPKTLLDYVWITHETDSFFGVLPYEDGTLPGNIESQFSIPSSIRIGKTATATLIVNTTGGRLKDSTLDKGDFLTTNKNRIQVTSVSKPSVKQTQTGYEYKYTLKLKAGLLIGYSNISLKSNVLELQLGLSKNIANRNNVAISSLIRTKLL